MSWQSIARTPGSDNTVSARFTFDSATSALTYDLTAGFPEGEVLAATIHRVVKDDNGPVIFVLANHPFHGIAGTETLSDPDRERLMSGGLYLRIALRSKTAGNLRIPLKSASSPPDRRP